MSITSLVGRLVDDVKDRVTASTVGLFSHGPDPLAHTLEHVGDPGLFGPDSLTWPVLGDVAAFVGGIRALIIQAAHPEVAAGVGDHSRYRDDPLGRLSRTSAYVTATAFGAMAEVRQAVDVVRGRHRPVHGTSHRGRPYDAGQPGLAAWVHNSLTDSFLVANQHFGGRHLSAEEADCFVAEQAAVGELLDATPLPMTASALADWIEQHPDLAPSPAQREAIEFLRRPPLSWPVRVAYGFLFRAAVATVPEPILVVVGLRRRPGALVAGKAMVAALRWALGASPSWHLALVRVGAPDPVRFRQPLPPAAEAVRRRQTGSGSAARP